MYRLGICVYSRLHHEGSVEPGRERGRAVLLLLLLLVLLGQGDDQLAVVEGRRGRGQRGSGQLQHGFVLRLPLVDAGLVAVLAALRLGAATVPVP